MKRIVYGFYSLLICVNLLLIVLCNNYIAVNAVEYRNSYAIDMNSSTIRIDDAFGTYQQIVDKNIYNEMSKYVFDILDETYGNINSPMVNMAKETINPCMAFATTWGEAGESYPSISLTTIMDFNPDTYVYDIDWIEISCNLEQVDDDWYRVNSLNDYNTNVDGNAYHMPTSLLQFPTSGSRDTTSAQGLGVGPYQITSSDWETWELCNRVSPIEGFRDSMKKTGDSWARADINPISDLTVYAALSLSHQGGALIDYDFGRNLINIINTPEVQDAFNEVGHEMYIEFRDRAYNERVGLSNINLTKHLEEVEQRTGVDFSKYTGGVGRTNKGNYTALHCLRYVFYKNYFTASN